MDWLKHNNFTDVVERATADTNVSENWELNMAICDNIVSRTDGPKDASKAIKKRLFSSKSVKTSLLALALLETCVNNCGQRFYSIVIGKDLSDYIKLIRTPKLDESVRLKLLDLIQIWATSISADPLVTGVREEHQKLISNGFQFPPRNLEELTPISQAPTAGIKPAPPAGPLPPGAAALPPGVTALPPGSYVMQQPPYAVVGQPGVVYARPPMMVAGAPQHVMFQQGQMVPMPPGVVFMQPGNNGMWVQPAGPQQQYPQTFVSPMPQRLDPTHHPVPKVKVSDEIVQFKETMNVFAETLAYTDPNVENVAENPLIMELEVQLRGMRARIQNLLGQVSAESEINALIEINDELNVQLQNYEDYRVRYVVRNNPAGGAGGASGASNAGVGAATIVSTTSVSLPSQASSMSFTSQDYTVAQGRTANNLISFDDDDNIPAEAMTAEQAREIESMLGQQSGAVLADFAGLDMSGAHAPPAVTPIPPVTPNNPFASSLPPSTQAVSSPYSAPPPSNQQAAPPPPSNHQPAQSNADVDFF